MSEPKPQIVILSTTVIRQFGIFDGKRSVRPIRDPRTGEPIPVQIITEELPDPDNFFEQVQETLAAEEAKLQKQLDERGTAGPVEEKPEKGKKGGKKDRRFREPAGGEETAPAAAAPVSPVPLEPVCSAIAVPAVDTHPAEPVTAIGRNGAAPLSG